MANTMFWLGADGATPEPLEPLTAAIEALSRIFEARGLDAGDMSEIAAEALDKIDPIKGVGNGKA